LTSRAWWAGHREEVAVVAATVLARATMLAWLCHAYVHDSALARNLFGDVDSWFRFVIGVRIGFAPYVDLPREYPVGASLLYVMIGLLDRRNHRIWRFMAWHGAVMAALDVVNALLFLALARERSPRRALPLTLLFSLNATAVLLSPVRFESAIVTTLLLGLRAAGRGRAARAALPLSLGTWLKWFPALLMPAAQAQSERQGAPPRSRLAVAGTFAWVALALNGPLLVGVWVRTGSIKAWLDTYRFHVARPLAPDSVLGAAQLWLGPLSVERWASAWSAIALVLALWWGLRRGMEASAVMAGAAILVLNRLYSPQFHLWFYPFLLLLAAAQPPRVFARLLAAWAALDLMNAAVYPFLFEAAKTELRDWPRVLPAVAPGPWTAWFTSVVVARSVVLLALAAMVLRLPWPSARGGRRAEEGVLLDEPLDGGLLRLQAGAPDPVVGLPRVGGQVVELALAAADHVLPSSLVQDRESPARPGAHRVHVVEVDRGR
jgi:hypothetical protein